MNSVFIFVLIIIGMSMIASLMGQLISLYRDKSRWKTENHELKQELEAVQNEMAALRERFDNQYANVTLALDDLRREKAVRREIADSQNERETLALEQTRRE